MKRKPLTNKEGEVRELTSEDFRAMRPIHEVLPPQFVANLLKLKKGKVSIKPIINKNGAISELTREVLPQEVFKNLPKRKRGQRGAQKEPTKIRLTVRYSPEVIRFFRSTGEGWQKRMDDVLKEWVHKHSHAA